MLKADLHVHSKYSPQPDKWFARRLGASECYTEPEHIFRAAQRAGMDLVAVTDHDRAEGAFLLKERYPREVMTGAELTSFFPENGRSVHVLVYGFTPGQFRELDRLRRDLYGLREYLKQENLAHAVAHPVYSSGGKLTADDLEKLLLLFDVFEGINGGRDRYYNNAWMEATGTLTPQRMESLRKKHGIEPYGGESWIKGFIGGSDDHAGIFIGATYTVADARDPESFLDSIRNKNTFADGRHNDYRSLAFTVCKVVSEFAGARGGRRARSLFPQAARLLFEGEAPGWRERMRLAKLRLGNMLRPGRPTGMFLALLRDLERNRARRLEERLERAYDSVAAISDEYLGGLARSLSRDLGQGDIARLFRSAASSVQGALLALPFLASAMHLHGCRALAEEFKARFGQGRPPGSKRVLWFTDTLTDLNGVSVIVARLGRLAHEQGRDLRVAAALGPDEMSDEVPPGTLALPFVHRFPLPEYEQYQLKVPSVLRALREIYAWEPDEVYISTPGPVGLFALLVARLMGLRAVGVYHTDFYLQSREITGDPAAADLLERYTKWFYGMLDEVKVPTREYMALLERRGFDPAKMKLFRKGIDPHQFSPRESGRELLRERFRVGDGVTLLFAGRVSKDKNLDLLSEAYGRLLRKRKDMNLVIAGDGPYLREYREKMKRFPRVVFTGRLRQEVLPEVYSGADLFVFPSATDTFGLAVLEALSCALPAVVSDAGGPKEILEDGGTGFIARAGDPADWEEKIGQAVALMSGDPRAWLGMKERARSFVLETCSWEAVLRDVLEEEARRERPLYREAELCGKAP